MALRAHPRLSVEALIFNYLDGETIETVAYIFGVDLELTRAIIQYCLDRAIMTEEPTEAEIAAIHEV